MFNIFDIFDNLFNQSTLERKLQGRVVHRILVDANIDDTVWGKRVIAASKIGKFTEDDCAEANSRATCPCSYLDKRVLGAVKDTGIEFCDAVTSNKVWLATQKLCEIHRQSDQLLRETK